MTDPLGPVPNYTIVTYGDLDLTNTDSEGRMVVGRDGTLSSFGIASKLPVDASAGRPRRQARPRRHQHRRQPGLGHLRAPPVREPDDPERDARRGRRRRSTSARCSTALGIRSRTWADLPQTGTVSGPLYGALTLTGDGPEPQRVQPHRGDAPVRRRAPDQGAGRVDDADQRRRARRTRPRRPTRITYWNGSAFVQLQNNEPQTPTSRSCGAGRSGTSRTRPRSTSGRRPRGRARSWRRRRSRRSAPSRSTARSRSARSTAWGRRTSIRPTCCLPDPTPCPPQPPHPDRPRRLPRSARRRRRTRPSRRRRRRRRTRPSRRRRRRRRTRPCSPTPTATPTASAEPAPDAHAAADGVADRDPGADRQSDPDADHRRSRPADRPGRPGGRRGRLGRRARSARR